MHGIYPGRIKSYYYITSHKEIEIIVTKILMLLYSTQDLKPEENNRFIAQQSASMNQYCNWTENKNGIEVICVILWYIGLNAQYLTKIL